MKETIKTILYSWIERELPEVIPRDTNIGKYLDTVPMKILVITGFRRVGKTYLVYNTIKELLRTMSKEDVMYINLDDERIPEKTEFLTMLIPTIIETFGKLPKYFFLDEIQNMPNWSKWLRRIYDTENMNIVVTGSSSKVSSRELPTELRGRCIEIPLFPLSFVEYLRFKNSEIKIELLPYSSKEKAKLISMLTEYVEYGGMPEVVLAEKAIKMDILQEYYRTVLMRDIIERFRVKNEMALKAVIRLLLNSTSYSISKLYNTLKSLNYEVGKTTLLHYVNYVESAYFIYSIPIFSYKVKDQLQYPRKVYFIDNGFLTSLSTKFSKNIGRKMENLVAIELLRRNSKKDVSIYYWRDHQGREVDFVIKEGQKINELIQVTYASGIDEIDRREIKALKKAGAELKCKNLTIITWDYEQEGEIKFLPLWKWLLNYRK